MRSLFPPATWLREYRLSWLRFDLVAGLTLAAYAIPVSLAYATLAGLPPVYGVYCYLVAGPAYALFGTSRQLAIGPTSAISMLVGTTVAGMAMGDPARYAEIAALTALVFAVISVIAWALRLSSLVNFISETILLGFKAGAALTIAMTQLPKLFGVKGGGDHFFERAYVLGTQLPDTNVVVLLFGVVAIALLVAGERLFPGRPVALFVVIAAIVALSVTPLAQQGFKTVGVLPAGPARLRAAVAAAARRRRRDPARVRLLPARVHRGRVRRAQPRPEDTATRSTRDRSSWPSAPPTPRPLSARAIRSRAACRNRRSTTRPARARRSRWCSRRARSRCASCS